MDRHIILLWGAPAAGKTAVARALVSAWRERHGRHLVHLATDPLSRAMVGSEYVPELRPIIYRGMEVMAEEIVAARLDVLLDANYLDPARRRGIEAVAARQGAVLRRVLVHCSLASRLARNRARVAAERVPTERVVDLHEQAAQAVGEADLVVDTDSGTVEEGVALILESLPPG